MAFTDEQKTQYVEQGGTACPYCGSGEIEGAPFQGEGTEVWSKVLCKSCGKSWQELFTLSGIDDEFTQEV